MATSHTNNCMAKAASESLSRLESHPVVIGEISLIEARVLWTERTKDALSLGNAIWFLHNGTAYRVNSSKTKCSVMSYWPY